MPELFQLLATFALVLFAPKDVPAPIVQKMHAEMAAALKSPEMAERLGYTEHPGQQDVERFMKHYFLVAKDVGDLTRILCASLEARQVKEVPGLGRVIGRLISKSSGTLRDAPDFRVVLR